MLKSDIHIFKGMQRDMSVSKQSPEFLWDAHNIRLTAIQDDTMLSVTNEKGTAQVSGVSFTGTYLGHCVMNNYLVVFTTHNGTDYIYRVNKTDNYNTEILYSGSLNFDPNFPIETLGVYENELVQKVYWVDGQNQPRLINIVKEQLEHSNVAQVRSHYNNSSFDFVRDLSLQESINVTRQAASGGQFQSGVIQYALTYYDKYGQESNIAYITPIHYITHNDRGGSPEEKVGVSFKVNISGLDPNFDYARLYSIYRSSLNGTPVVKRLTDIPITQGMQVTGGSIPSNKAYYYRASGTILISTSTLTDKYILYFSDYLEDVPSGNGMAGGKYYHFTRAKFPFLEVHVDNLIITWGGNTDLYISYSSYIGGPGASDKRLITGGYGTSNYMYIGTTATYGTAIGGAFYIDNGTGGEIIDSASLLYVGGETVTASTIAQKDGTLFLGNLKITRPPVNNLDNIDTPTTTQGTRPVTLAGNNSSNYYSYLSILTATNNGYSVNPTGFKRGERYRFGIQLQYKSGKWSDPIFLKDDNITSTPSLSNTTLNIPKYRLSVDLRNVPSGYKRVRGVVVFPSMGERTIVAQGIATPTVFNLSSRKNGIPYAQSSWFFRPAINPYLDDDTNKGPNALQGSVVEYAHGNLLLSHGDRGAEIQGTPEFSGRKYVGTTPSSGSITFPNVNDGGEQFSVSWDEATSLFAVDRSIVTMHGPDIEFDDSIDSLDLSGLNLRKVGNITFNADMGDISLQTSTPTIHSDGSGFIHRSLKTTDPARILAAGLYYSDYLVDDNDERFMAYDRQNYDYLFMIYPWHKTGSINNDTVRPADKGVRSSVLSKKRISNLRFSKNVSWNSESSLPCSDIQLFSSDQVTMLKLNSDYSYYGNVDTMLSPVRAFSVVFSNGDTAAHSAHPDTGSPKFTDSKYRLLYMTKGYGRKQDSSEEGRMWQRAYGSSSNLYTVVEDGEHIGDAQGSLATSKEAIRMKYKSTKHIVVSLNSPLAENTGLPIVELYRTGHESTMFGGTSEDAKKSNVWLPAGEPIAINRMGLTNVDYIYGDTYYQRYDCLKTYPFTLEDENSITEIASFLVESRVNIDGRYDKNRGQASNLVTTPVNFNLLNPVYSQPNNFFSYRILDSDYYKLDNFQSSITWSLNKQSAAMVDTWARVSLANILDLDGNMGAVTALVSANDNLYCFQESGVSQVLFNSRVQVPTSDNNPIEISNNYKVDGNRYISDSVGVKNKWAITKSINGLYFIDSTGNTLYNLGNGLTDISGTHGFSHWFDEQNVDTPWTPLSYSTRLFYDKNRNDLYIASADTSLVFSEVLNQFISFMSYGGTPAMFNIGSDFYAIKGGKLWKLFEGNYNTFFGSYKPFDITFISNAESGLDKIFTNLELRADFYSNGTIQHTGMFDYIRAWNEYQDTGNVVLDFKRAKPSNLKKKFRIWRIDIPRDSTRRRDRVRNTWTYIKLGTKPDVSTTNNMVLHDIVTQYFV